MIQFPTRRPPWPIAVLAAFYAICVILQIVQMFSGHFLQLIWLPIYAAMAFGLWTLQPWGRLVTIVVNALLGITVVVFMIYSGIKIAQNYGPDLRPLLLHMVGVDLALLLVSWGPFIYLTRPSTKLHFTHPAGSD